MKKNQMHKPAGSPHAVREAAVQRDAKADPRVACKPGGDSNEVDDHFYVRAKAQDGKPAADKSKEVTRR